MLERFRQKLTERPAEIREAKAEAKKQADRLETEGERDLELRRQAQLKTVAEKQKRVNEERGIFEELLDQIQFQEHFELLGEALGAKPGRKAKRSFWNGKHRYRIRCKSKWGKIYDTEEGYFWTDIYTPGGSMPGVEPQYIGREKKWREKLVKRLAKLDDRLSAGLSLPEDQRVECCIVYNHWEPIRGKKALIPINQEFYNTPSSFSVARFIAFNHSHEENLAEIQSGMIEIYDKFLEVSDQSR